MCQSVRVTHQEVEDAEAQHLEGDTDVSVVVEPVQHLHAQAANKRTTGYQSVLRSQGGLHSAEKIIKLNALRK